MQQKKKVLCFGELLLRLSPSLNDSWIKDARMQVYLGGAELNVAQALATWGIPVRYCSALPANSLSDNIADYLIEKGIDVSAIKHCGDRIGTYYMAQGADLKNAGVIYDRSNSSFALLKKGMIDWDEVFEGVNWFHFTAIIPALSNDLAELCEEALQVAVSKNITISLDLNYRAKLWKYGKTPLQVMPTLAKYCDLIMGNIWAFEGMLGIPLNAGLIEKNEQSAYLDQAVLTSDTVRQEFPKCRIIANTFRFNGASESEINYYAALYDQRSLYVSPSFTSSEIIDKSGTGDCFMAGLIYSYINHSTPQDTIDFAAASACAKFFIKGDATTFSVAEIKQKSKNKLA